jgi:Bacteriocin-protection, YdeI or OmpD-Associated/Domain of unknown function (DUF1905)
VREEHEGTALSTQRFNTTIARDGTGAYILIPFDPDEVWGAKDRHYVAGSIDDRPFRGCLDSEGPRPILPIGAAWIRDNDLGDGVNVDVILAPDGHQIETISSDIAAALTAEPEARAFFESVAPFYRNNYIRWIESARRPETRGGRIAEMVKSLKAGKKRL